MKASHTVSQELADLTSRYQAPEWTHEECDKVASCEECDRTAPLRMVPETERHECRGCWDRDTLGPEES